MSDEKDKNAATESDAEPIALDVGENGSIRDQCETDTDEEGKLSGGNESIVKDVEQIVIPNPMCAIEYSYPLAEFIGEDTVASVRTSDEGNDMSYDELEKVLKGTPLTSRDYWMEIELQTKIIRLTCFINENPRLLWKDIPSEQKVKPDKDWMSLLSPTVDIVAASHRGRMHANRGTYRDDDFYIGRVDTFTLSIVADGAGSAQLSSTGSKVFCREVGNRLFELVREKEDELMDIINNLQSQQGEMKTDPRLSRCLYEILPVAALHGRKRLMQLADDNQVPLKFYHTTALLSITTPIADGSYFCAAFQIGDGITAALTDGQLTLLGKGDSGSFPGETVFVTSNGIFDDGAALLKRIHYLISEAKPTVISMTDGITDSYFKDTPALDNPEKWRQFVADISDESGHLRPAVDICDWLNYYIDQEHDDRTVSVVMYK